VCNLRISKGSAILAGEIEISVIASAARQSRPAWRQTAKDCRAALAMTNVYYTRP